MTTSDLVTATRDVLGADTSGFVSDASIVRWLNIAQRDLCKSGDILVSIWTTSTVQNQEFYSIPSDYVKVVAIYLYRTSGDSAKRILWPIGGDVTQLDPTKPTGTPDSYYVWGLNVSGVNSVAIGLRPIPSANGSSDLELWGRQLGRTMDMASLGGGHSDVDPEIKGEWCDELVHYAAARGFMRMTRNDPSVASLADREMSMWNSAVKKAKGYRNPMAIGAPTIRPNDYNPGYEYD